MIKLLFDPRNLLKHKIRRFSCGSQSVNLQPLLDDINKSILTDLESTYLPIKDASLHYFLSSGKMIRPRIVLLLSKIVNWKMKKDGKPIMSQISVAKFAEMIHTASLIHDDVVDRADMRRNKPSVNALWGEKTAILAGNLIMSRATISISELNDPKLISILTNVLLDLVSGELLQLESNSNIDQFIENYVKKSYFKTGSLISHTCKSAAYLAGCEEGDQERCFQLGKDLGIAFQLIDDCLDYSSSKITGKPSSVDAKQGLVTGPVFFAAKKFPQLYEIIQRKFNRKDDPEVAHELVLKSDGVAKTKDLADRFTKSALNQLEKIGGGPYASDLNEFIKYLVTREN